MRILLTGADGFIGQHLHRRLVKDGHQVSAPLHPHFDLRSEESVNAAVAACNPELIIHLAGLSHVPTCAEKPEQARAINVGGTRLLCNAIVNTGCRMIFASTAQVYEAPHGEELAKGVIFDENRALIPQNIYAQTKLEAEKVIAASGVPATILRLFNHTHKTQAPSFFLPSVYHGLLAEHDRHAQPRVLVGNVDIYRDIGAIQDLVEAFRALLRKPALTTGQTYNICSGHRRHLVVLIALLGARLGVSPAIEVDPARVRQGEPHAIQGSHAKFTAATGWNPACQSDDQLIEAFLADV